MWEKRKQRTRGTGNQADTQESRREEARVCGGRKGERGAWFQEQEPRSPAKGERERQRRRSRGARGSLACLLLSSSSSSSSDTQKRESGRRSAHSFRRLAAGRTSPLLPREFLPFFFPSSLFQESLVCESCDRATDERLARETPAAAQAVAKSREREAVAHTLRRH